MNEAQFKITHRWIDPTLGYPSQELIPGVKKLAKARHMAVRTGAAHKLLPWLKPCHSAHLVRVDGHEWEIFRADKENEVYFWGMFVEGLGAFDVMFPKAFCRELLPEEREAWSKVVLGMYGSHSGKLSYTTPSGVRSDG